MSVVLIIVSKIGNLGNFVKHSSGNLDPIADISSPFLLLLPYKIAGTAIVTIHCMGRGT